MDKRFKYWAGALVFAAVAGLGMDLGVATLIFPGLVAAFVFMVAGQS